MQPLVCNELLQKKKILKGRVQRENILKETQFTSILGFNMFYLIHFLQIFVETTVRTWICDLTCGRFVHPSKQKSSLSIVFMPI